MMIEWMLVYDDVISARIARGERLFALAMWVLYD